MPNQLWKQGTKLIKDGVKLCKNTFCICLGAPPAPGTVCGNGCSDIPNTFKVAVSGTLSNNVCLNCSQMVKTYTGIPATRQCHWQVYDLSNPTCTGGIGVQVDISVVGGDLQVDVTLTWGLAPSFEGAIYRKLFEPPQNCEDFDGVVLPYHSAILSVPPVNFCIGYSSLTVVLTAE